MKKDGPEPNRKLDRKIYKYRTENDLSFGEIAKIVDRDRANVYRKFKRHKKYLEEKQQG